MKKVPSGKMQSEHPKEDCLTEAREEESKPLCSAEIESANSTRSAPAPEEQDRSERKISPAHRVTALIPQASDSFTDQKLCCACSRLIRWIHTKDLLDCSGEFQIEKAPSFDELIASFRQDDDAAGSSGAEGFPQESHGGHCAQSLPACSSNVPSCPPATTSSPSGGSVSALRRLSFADDNQGTGSCEGGESAAEPSTKDEMLSTGCKSYSKGSPDPLGHSQVKDPGFLSGSLTSAGDRMNRAQETGKHEQPAKPESDARSPVDTSPTKFDKRALDREMANVFKDLCHVITIPGSSLDEVKALVGKLRDNGYSLDSGGDSIVSPLVLAALENRADVSRLLLNHGADPDASLVHMSNVTALHVACSHRAMCDTLPLVSLLLQKGASLKARTVRGDTPLVVARGAGNSALVEYLENQGALE